MNANNANGYGYHDTRPLAATADYTVVKHSAVQNAFNTIHGQLQRDQAWVSLGYALECIELLHRAAEAFALAADPRWKPKS